MRGTVDHLVVGAADLDDGIAWVAKRLGVAPVFGGVHDGFGTRNALAGLGPQYLEVLSPDPAQADTTSPFTELIRSLEEPMVLSVAIATSGLTDPVPMSRVRPDGVVLRWELQFTATALFFIDWKDCPRPSGLPEAGRLSAVTITTPEPDVLDDVDGVTVHRGPWRVEASVNGTPLV